ncbi:MAG: AAA family ATPase [Eubacteriaceae bacterium]|nr:AAA family ATPase [Eubacteriaceae bacterium]
MGVILALFNQKGGVGKTTTCSNLSSCLALNGKRVLAVDFDPQSNLTSGLGVDRNSLAKTVYNVIIDGVNPIEAIVETSTPNLWILPASIDLAGAEIEMSSMAQRELLLKKALDKVKDAFNFILIDCPPSLGLLSINALAAATGVLVPIQCEYYALEGVSQLINTINLVKRSLNPFLEVEGVILTMFDTRTNLSQQVMEEVTAYFGNKVYKSIIPRNIRLAEAPSYGMTISQYDNKSKGALAYNKLSEEMIQKR